MVPAVLRVQVLRAAMLKAFAHLIAAVRDHDPKVLGHRSGEAPPEPSPSSVSLSCSSSVAGNTSVNTGGLDGTMNPSNLDPYDPQLWISARAGLVVSSR